MSSRFPYHDECNTLLEVTVDQAFVHLDDHARLTEHMNKSSWMMAGSSMQLTFDALRGQAVGSHISMSGRVLGVPLFVEEIVSDRSPPLSKVWETIGETRLLVIGHYRMGFELTPSVAGCQLRIFIDYAKPKGWLSWCLGRLLARYYARWCLQRMKNDAIDHFSQKR